MPGRQDPSEPNGFFSSFFPRSCPNSPLFLTNTLDFATPQLITRGPRARLASKILHGARMIDDDDDAIFLAALELAEQQTASRGHFTGCTAAPSPHVLATQQRRPVQQTCEHKVMSKHIEERAREVSQQRMHQQQINFMPHRAAVRCPQLQPSLLAQNSATLQHEREVQARFKAAAAAKQKEKEEQARQARQRTAKVNDACDGGGQSGHFPRASMSKQSLLVPKAPTMRVHSASLLQENSPKNLHLTPAGLSIEVSKTLLMPYFGREYQR
jgi:hypothetical protein